MNLMIFSKNNLKRSHLILEIDVCQRINSIMFARESILNRCLPKNEFNRCLYKRMKSMIFTKE